MLSTQGTPPAASPFRSILRLVFGDLASKALNLLTFLYLARALGVSSFGVLELAVSAVMYFALAADGGLELWATREASRTGDRGRLVARVLPLRLLLAALTAGLLVLFARLFPDYPLLRRVLTLYALTLFAQALSLRWALLGRQQMGRVAAGAVAGQLAFAAAVVALVRAPEQIVWVPMARLAGDLLTAAWYLMAYRTEHPESVPRFTLRGWREIALPAFAIGASSCLALASFNLDSILLGFLAGPVAVGLYGAAYKPISVVLAMPVSYFIGLFPVLSRAFRDSPDDYRRLVSRSLHLSAVAAAPIVVGGAFLAGPILELLFGPGFSGGAPALRILACSAALVILRGTYRQALNAAERSKLDLLCAGVATVVNLGLNLLLIPAYGILGAAAATVASEVVWLSLASTLFRRFVFPAGLPRHLARPAAAALGMAAFLWLGWPHPWIARALAATAVYLLALGALGDPEVRSWPGRLRSAW